MSNSENALVEEYAELYNSIEKRCTDDFFQSDFQNPYEYLYGKEKIKIYRFDNNLIVGKHKSKKVIIISEEIPINEGEVTHIVMGPDMIHITSAYRKKEYKQCLHMSTNPRETISHNCNYSSEPLEPKIKEFVDTKTLSIKEIEEYLIEMWKFFNEQYVNALKEFNRYYKYYKSKRVPGSEKNDELYSNRIQEYKETTKLYYYITQKYKQMLNLFRKTRELARKQEIKLGKKIEDDLFR